LLSGDVAALRAVVVLELWLDEDPLVGNLCPDGAKEGNDGILLLISEVGGALGVLDDGQWVCYISKDRIDVLAESGVVHQA